MHQPDFTGWGLIAVLKWTYCVKVLLGLACLGPHLQEGHQIKVIKPICSHENPLICRIHTLRTFCGKVPTPGRDLIYSVHPTAVLRLFWGMYTSLSLLSFSIKPDFRLKQRLFIWNQTLIKAALSGIFRLVLVCSNWSQFVIRLSPEFEMRTVSFLNYSRACFWDIILQSSSK